MKKFLAVLAIVLIAMTSVFAEEVGNKKLNVTLTVVESTEFAFTTSQVSNNAFVDQVGQSLPVTAGSTTTLYASYITKSADQIKVDVAVTKPLTHDDYQTEENVPEYAKFKTTLRNDTDTTVSVTEDAEQVTGLRSNSIDVSVVVAAETNQLAGNYTGTLTLTVSAV